MGIMVGRRRTFSRLLHVHALHNVRFHDMNSPVDLTNTALLSMSVHDSQLSTMTAAWLLPVVPTIVVSATGGLMAGVLLDQRHALWTLIISYVLWGMGISLALFTLVMYFQRLTLHRLPAREVIVSVFLPLGPLGQGGFAVLQMGKVALKILPETAAISTNAGEILYVLGFMVALIMWGFGLVWLFFALASISRSKFPFNMGMFSRQHFQDLLLMLCSRLVGIHFSARRICLVHDLDR